MGIGISDKHLVCSLASVSEMVSSPAFNVSMLIWSLPVTVPFFISRIAASTSHMLTLVPLLGQCGLWYSLTVLWLDVVSHYSFYDHILIMDSSTLLV